MMGKIWKVFRKIFGIGAALYALLFAVFYFDLDASVYDEAALQLLSELDAGPETFTYLGSYSEI